VRGEGFLKFKKEKENRTVSTGKGSKRPAVSDFGKQGGHHHQASLQKTHLQEEIAEKQMENPESRVSAILLTETGR